ncbi:MAG TPA: hypothetical protein VHP64_05370 [Candidatus Limnocylindria bacterium]|nr:hypothetical protein [Candidatus Limnocylindria bacterium]
MSNNTRMGTSLIIGHPDDLIATAVAKLLEARNRPVAKLTRWSDARISFGSGPAGAEPTAATTATATAAATAATAATAAGLRSSLVMRAPRKEIPLEDLSMVLYRGIPAINSKLSRRSQRYAQEEWQAALSVLSCVHGCPVLNSPFPDNPAGRDHHTTHAGWRARGARALETRGLAPSSMSNLVTPTLGSYAVGLICNGPARVRDLEQARQGFELLSIRRLRSQRVPLYWIVGGAVILEKTLDLRSGAVADGKFGDPALGFAEQCARIAGLGLGTLWLFPGPDDRWCLGGLDRFPPSHHLDGGEAVVAAAICDRYADGAATPLHGGDTLS